MPREDTRQQQAELGRVTDGLTDPLLGRLRYVTLELASLHRELASLLSKEKEQRLQTWMASDSDTKYVREFEADWNVIETTKDILQVKGEIAAYLAEKEFLVLLVGVK